MRIGLRVATEVALARCRDQARDAVSFRARAERAEVEVELGEVVRDLAAGLVGRRTHRKLLLERRDLALEHLHRPRDGGGVARDLVRAHDYRLDRPWRCQLEQRP